jgi:hypothetical protein
VVEPKSRWERHRGPAEQADLGAINDRPEFLIDRIARLTSRQQQTLGPLHVIVGSGPPVVTLHYHRALPGGRRLDRVSWRIDKPGYRFDPPKIT